MSLPGDSSAELRAFYLRWVFQPLAAELLRAHADVQSVTLACAQYYNDEARDAVHLAVLPSTDRAATWPEPVGGGWGRHERVLRAQRALTGRRYGGFYGDNYDFIVAFAAYCRPGAHQELRMVEAYLPYAVARRAPEGLTLEVVGQVQQPEWEDRFARPSRTPEDQGPRLASRVARLRAGRPIPPEELLESWRGFVAEGETEHLCHRLFEALQTQKGVRACMEDVEAWLRAHGVTP